MHSKSRDLLLHLDPVVADVAGKGFAASLVMASVKAMLPFVTADGGVDDALTELNRRLQPELGRGEFVALALARYRPAERRIALANAGTPDPYLLRAGQAPQALSVPGARLPLGLRRQVVYDAVELPLDAGARLLMISDGLPEAQQDGGEPLGYEAFEEMLAGEGPVVEPAAWLARLFDTLQRRTGRLPEDDWTAALLAPRSEEAGG